ncbi:MAG: tryptophan-rich sensory protein [Gemmatimonadaceae bacterium]|nr:tryptophan-rich sensory protein [Gemmatimonadaceae bacterium]MCC6430772.1 tryptophan-rich sensory protein [Gemmatimonadaceae bacterium]
MQRTILSLSMWILGTSVAAISGAVTAGAARDFYAQLNKPSWAPPAWLFGPAWTVLYVVMAVAAWRIWRTYGFEGARAELLLYGVQLAFNAGWSWFFFVKRSGLASTVEVSFLLTSVVATMIAFWAKDVVAGVLFLPYVTWVSFATALTVSVWRRNPHLL